MGPRATINGVDADALLTLDEVRAALGGGEVQLGFGTLASRTSGAAGVVLDIDTCSWQQHAGRTLAGPSRSRSAPLGWP
jgi:hypothetical protein